MTETRRDVCSMCCHWRMRSMKTRVICNNWIVHICKKWFDERAVLLGVPLEKIAPAFWARFGNHALITHQTSRVVPISDSEGRAYCLTFLGPHQITRLCQMQKCFGRKRDYFLALIFQREHFRGKCHVRKKRAVSGVTNLFKWNPLTLNRVRCTKSLNGFSFIICPHNWYGAHYTNQAIFFSLFLLCLLLMWMEPWNL